MDDVVDAGTLGKRREGKNGRRMLRGGFEIEGNPSTGSGQAKCRSGYLNLKETKARRARLTKLLWSEGFSGFVHEGHEGKGGVRPRRGTKGHEKERETAKKQTPEGGNREDW